MTHARRATLFLLAVCLAVAPLSCGQSEQIHKAGGSGGANSSPISVRTEQDGELFVGTVWRRRTPNDAEPAVLMIVRVPTKDSQWGGISINSSGNDGVAQITSHAGKDWGSYEVKAEPFSESFTLADSPCNLDDGRLFLLDVVAQPPKVTQLQTSRLDVFRPSSVSSLGEAREAVKLLAEEHEAVAEFLGTSK